MAATPTPISFAVGGAMVALLLSSLGCASTGARRIATPRVDTAALVREAEAEIDRGCYLCLLSATEKYEAAIAAGAIGVERKTAGAFALVAARERELGLKPSAAMDNARKHGGSTWCFCVACWRPERSWLALFDALASFHGMARPAPLDAELARGGGAVMLWMGG